MKIALIAPPYPLEEAPSPPLGLAYVAGACEAAGATVRILDYIVRQYTRTKIEEELTAFGPDIIGTTAVTMNFDAAVGIIEDAKRHNPALIAIMGGPHVSFAVKETLEGHPLVDLIILGEGERTLSELLPVIHDRQAWHAIPGLAFREGGRTVKTAPRPLIEDLDSLPLPARHLLPMSRYQALGFPVSIITSRGCPNRCIFCQGRRMVGHKVRFRSTTLVVDEIEQILAYGIDRINIADDLFTANKKRVRAFCEEIRRRGLSFTWSAFSRVNTIDAEVLTLMRDAGCDSVSFGIESGNADMLKTVRKGITLDQARQAIACCKEVGVIAHASFMVGLPGESHQTMQDSENLAQELDIPYGYHLLAPFPGTTVRERIADYDLEILSNDWRLYDANRAIVRTSHLEPAEMDAFVAGVEEHYKAEWEEVKQRCREGKCTPREKLRVEGEVRMRLIYRLLSEDLLERYGAVATISPDALRDIASDIAGITALDSEFVHFTLQSLINVGYVKGDLRDGTARYFWTHNNRTEVLPVA